MINLYGKTLSKLEELMLAEGQKKYRATQLYIWLYEKKATSFDEMSDISLSFRNVLKEKYCIKNIQPVDMFPFTSHVECVACLELKETLDK